MDPNAEEDREMLKSVRRRFFRWLAGDVLDGLEAHRSSLPAQVRAEVGASLEPVLEWNGQAEAHLAALQQAHEDGAAQLRTAVDRLVEMQETLAAVKGSADDLRPALTVLREEFETRGRELASALDWIRGAEEHLAALQSDHDRLRVLSEHHRLVARVTLVEARLRDLERADQALAAAVAKARMTDAL